MALPLELGCVPVWLLTEVDEAETNEPLLLLEAVLETVVVEVVAVEANERAVEDGAAVGA